MIKRAKIIAGTYKGVYGWCDEVNRYGNVMFYPDDKKPVYCICKKAEEVEYINE